MSEYLVVWLNAVYTWILQHACSHTGYFIRERLGGIGAGYRCMRCGIWRRAPWDIESKDENNGL